MLNMKISKYATSFKTSKGRYFEEKEDTFRTPYQRDRDRIIHSSAFRRLEHKTQVFIHHEGDHYRSRLTHSLEVSQIARTISRALMLDEDLSEAIALAHDLGHTPFGHSGEDALHFAMQNFGGFDHNAQTLRIISYLEKKYFEFDGLNLTWETLEGIVKHNGPINLEEIPYAIKDYVKKGFDLNLDTWCGPEAQVASLSDDIAYFSHDIEDGIRANFFKLEDLITKIPFLQEYEKKILSKNIDKEIRRKINAMKRYIISKLINDLLMQTKKNLSILKPLSSQDIRLYHKPIVEFSEEMKEHITIIRNFLMERMYKHWKINRMTSKAKRIIKDLFNIYFEEPNCLPQAWKNEANDSLGDFLKARVISDYIAGMTDRYAISEHKKLYDFSKGWY